MCLVNLLQPQWPQLLLPRHQQPQRHIKVPKQISQLQHFRHRQPLLKIHQQPVNLVIIENRYMFRITVISRFLFRGPSAFNFTFKIDLQESCDEFDGVLGQSGTTCCAKICGKCGGAGCKDRPGGKESCCGKFISKTQICGETLGPWGRRSAPCHLKTQQETGKSWIVVNI